MRFKINREGLLFNILKYRNSIQENPEVRNDKRRIARALENILGNKLASMFISIGLLTDIGRDPGWLLESIKNDSGTALDFIRDFDPEPTPDIYTTKGFTNPLIRAKNQADKNTLMQQINFTHIYKTLYESFNEIKTYVITLQSKHTLANKDDFLSLNEKIKLATNTLDDIVQELRG